MLLFLSVVAVAVSLAASWLLVSRLERLGERAGFSEAWLGLAAALAADMPEITSAVTALIRGQPGVGAGVVTGSNVFNLAALLGLAAVVAGRIGFHRRVVLLAGVPGIWVAAACLLVTAAAIPPAAGLVLVAVVLLPGTAVLGMRRDRIQQLPVPDGWARWLIAAVHEEETELAEAIRPPRGTWRDAATAAAALAVVVAASTLMEVVVTAAGQRFAVAPIVTGGLVLAVLTSLPNAVAAVYLAIRGRGAAVLSTALNSNAINVLAGLLVPASLTGLGPRNSQSTLVAAWYAGLTVLALALAYRDRGLRRVPGAVIIAGYLAFMAALLISTRQHDLRPATAVLPAALIAAAALIPAAWPARRQASLLPRWTTRQICAASLTLCLAVAACDTASGPHLILIGLLITGPCCALLTARWTLTAAVTCFALTLGIAQGIPDHIFATTTQYALLAAVAGTGLAATVSAALLQRQRSHPGTCR